MPRENSRGRILTPLDGLPGRWAFNPVVRGRNVNRVVLEIQLHVTHMQIEKAVKRPKIHEG